MLELTGNRCGTKFCPHAAKFVFALHLEQRPALIVEKSLLQNECFHEKRKLWQLPTTSLYTAVEHRQRGGFSG